MSVPTINNDNNKKVVCSRCGKPKTASNVLGSLTSYLFRATLCQCDGAGNSAGVGNVDDDSQFCPKCGLQVVTEEKAGSLTSYLFQSTRCKCPRDQAFVKGQMSAKFWKLKKAGASTIFAPADDREQKAGQTDRAGQTGQAGPTGPIIGLAPGAIIGGVYEVIEIIGRGGMGEVYLARHQALGKKCALKVIPPEQVTEMGWQRFQIEARTLAKLDHANIVKVTDLGIHDGCLPFYAMEYVRGKNLADLLAEHGPMPPSDFYDVFMQVCDGVECAHRNGILHRDLKPGNIMVSIKPDGKKIATVLDFGLAKLTAHDRSKQSLTAVGDVFGSPFYMSPEQCNGEKLDNRSDIYSIGCTMFECLTGRTPFAGHLAAAIMFSHQEADPPSLSDVAGAGKFPTSLEVVIAKLLRKNPVERYQNMSQLKGDLERVKLGQDVLPVYANRGFSTDAEVSHNAKQTYERGPQYQTSGNITGLLLVLTGVVVVGGAVAALALYGINSLQAKHEAQIKAAANRTKNTSTSIIVAMYHQVPAKDRAFDGQPFFKKTVEISGKLYDKWVIPVSNLFPLSIDFNSQSAYEASCLGSLFPSVEKDDETILSDPKVIDHFGYKSVRHGWAERLVAHGSMAHINVNHGLDQAPQLLNGLDSRNYSSICLRTGNIDSSTDSLKRLTTIASIDSVQIVTRMMEKTEADSMIMLLKSYPNLKEITTLVNEHFIAALDELPTVQKLNVVVEFASQNVELAALRNCRKLKVLTVNSSTHAATAVKLVAQVPQLEKLGCSLIDGTSEEILEIAKLANLKYLELPDLKYRDGLLDDLSQLSHVKTIVAGEWPLGFAIKRDGKIIPEGIFELAVDSSYVGILPESIMSGLRNTTRMKVSNGHWTREQMMLLSRLPKLTTLEWPKIMYAPGIGDELGRIRSLRKLVVSRYRPVRTVPAFELLRRELPNLEIEVLNDW